MVKSHGFRLVSTEKVSYTIADNDMGIPGAIAVMIQGFLLAARKLVHRSANNQTK